MRREICAVVGFAVVFAGLAGCRGPVMVGEGKPAMELTSTSFAGGEIGKRFTCDGGDNSPELGWGAPPPATRSLVVLAIDRDAPIGTFVHWVLYDLAADKRELAEGLSKQGELPDGSRQGQNDFDKVGYGGPCPLGTSTHRYVFAVYALDAKLNLPGGATRAQVEKAFEGHILARGELVGRYHR